MSNSPLVSYVQISPYRNILRTHPIDTITIHCVVGQWTAQRIGAEFSKPNKDASSNYGVGFDGQIGMYVEEKDVSWCSSNSDNDNRAITIEVASDIAEPFSVTDAAYNSLIKLCADICSRNGIKELKWKADKSLVGQVDKQNMTVHRWFDEKSCPGTFLYSHHSDIANKVNEILKGDNEMRFYRLKEIPNDYLPTIEKLIAKGYLKGKGGTGSETIIDLSEDSVRSFVINDRAKVYDNYYYFKDVPDVYKPELKEIINKGYFKGKGGSGDNLIVDLNEYSLRALLVAIRCIKNEIK